MARPGTAASRRNVIGLLAAAPLVSSAAEGEPIAEACSATGVLTVVADRAVLKALRSPPGSRCYLAEAGREGIFVCRAGLSSRDDPLEGLVVPSVGARTHWAREWDDTHGLAEWFGARPNDPQADCRASLETAHALCPVLLLRAADYHIRDTLILDRSGRTVQGTSVLGRDVGYPAPARMGVEGATRVILSGPAVIERSVARLGAARSTADDMSQMRNSVVQGIAFCRDCGDGRPRASLNDDPINCVKGVVICYASGCRFEDLTSFDSPVGFHVFGCVFSYIVRPAAFRVTAADGATDFGIGFLVGGYDINFYIAANASLYLDAATAYDLAGSLTIGIKLFGYVADTFVRRPEVGRVDLGIEVDGRDRGRGTVTMKDGPAAQQDVRIQDAIIDAVRITGLQIRNINRNGEILVHEPYIAAGQTSAGGVRIFGCEGRVSLSGGRSFGGGTGIDVADARRLELRGFFVRDAARPLVLANVSFGRIEPCISNDAASAPVAIAMRGCTGNLVAPIVESGAGRTGQVVALTADCRRNAIETVMVDPGVVAGEDALVRFGDQDARGSAAFRAAGNRWAGVAG